MSIVMDHPGGIELFKLESNLCSSWAKPYGLAENFHMLKQCAQCSAVAQNIFSILYIYFQIPVIVLRRRAQHDIIYPGHNQSNTVVPFAIDKYPVKAIGLDANHLSTHWIKRVIIKQRSGSQTSTVDYHGETKRFADIRYRL